MTRRGVPPWTLSEIKPEDIERCDRCDRIIVWVPDARQWVHWDAGLTHRAWMAHAQSRPRRGRKVVTDL